jgi:hypothetical protein
LIGIGKRHVGLQQQIDEYINRHDLRGGQRIGYGGRQISVDRRADLDEQVI